MCYDYVTISCFDLQISIHQTNKKTDQSSLVKISGILGLNRLTGFWSAIHLTISNCSLKLLTDRTISRVRYGPELK